MKEFYIVMSEKMNKKIVCRLCGKKYGGRRGMKFHFQYSHGILLKNSDFDKCETEFTCRICYQNSSNCNCSISWTRR